MSRMITAEILVFLAAGAALGAVYFGLLLWTVRLHAAQATAARVIPLYLARLAMAICAFWIIAQHGALPLLLALAGFLISRTAAQHWLRLA